MNEELSQKYRRISAKKTEFKRNFRHYFNTTKKSNNIP